MMFMEAEINSVDINDFFHEAYQFFDFYICIHNWRVFLHVILHFLHSYMNIFMLILKAAYLLEL